MSNFTLILTDQCNFDCPYCYQKKGDQRLDCATLVKAVDALYVFFAAECFINFYGGEPLLAIDVLKKAVEHFENLSKTIGAQFRYSLTTNGSLLTDEILEFLNEHAFSLTLSFDGLAQDLSRKKGSFGILSSAIPRILARPRITLETNSVFSSETIAYLAASVELIVRLGVSKIDINFAHRPSWSPASLLLLEREFARVGEFFLSRFKKLPDIPWADFFRVPTPAVYHCPAGRGQLTLSAQGTLWGCALFPQYFAAGAERGESGRYCFGDVDTFLGNARSIYAQKIAHYDDLRMTAFSTPERMCLMCREIEQCWICPLAAGLSTGRIGRIPSWNCQVAKILRKERQSFIERFENKSRRIREPFSA